MTYIVSDYKKNQENGFNLYHGVRIQRTSQSASQPASQSDRLTSASQSVLERQTDLYNKYIYIYNK